MPKRPRFTNVTALPGDRPGTSDAPTAGDHRRLQRARRQAQDRVAEIEKERDAAMLAAFRIEIGGAIRSASPLLISLLAINGLTLDDAVALIRPQAGWPRHPRLSGDPAGVPFHANMARSGPVALQRTQLSVPPLHGHRFDRVDGGTLLIQVADHSLELYARIGRVDFETRFGELRVEFIDRIPEIIFSGCVGRLIEEVVDHEALRGRDWRIVALDERSLVSGQALVVATGSVEYRMSWSR